MKKKNGLLILAVFGLAVSGGLAGTVRVTGDRVSLRSGPTVDAELLARANRGDTFTSYGQSNGWVAVEAPDSISFWAHGDYIEANKVVPDRLNIRSGPSANYTVMAVLESGTSIQSRGEFNGWVKLAPPAGSCVWISGDYVAPVGVQHASVRKPQKMPPPAKTVKRSPTRSSDLKPASPAQVAAPTKATEKLMPRSLAVRNPGLKGPAVPALAIPELTAAEKKPLVLRADPKRKQGLFMEKAGILYRSHPGLYKLVDLKNGEYRTLCLVRGQKEQMDKYLNRSMLIKGRCYWAVGVDFPVLHPAKIHLDPILK